jgi:hypothetical protein
MSAGRKIRTQSQHWGTPEKYVRAVKTFFGGAIALDPCSNEFSIVGAKTEYRLPDHDGLKESWDFPTIFVNPPYGLDHQRGTAIRHWLQRCHLSHEQHGAEVLALVPVATNTGHWKKHVFGVATAVCFLYDTRLRFLVDGADGGKGAPMSCAMIYWGRNYWRFFEIFRQFGAVLNLGELQKVKIGVVSNEGIFELAAAS